MNNLWKGIAILGLGLAVAGVGQKSPDAGIAIAFFLILPIIAIARS